MNSYSPEMINVIKMINQWTHQWVQGSLWPQGTVVVLSFVLAQVLGGLWRRWCQRHDQEVSPWLGVWIPLFAASCLYMAHRVWGAVGVPSLIYWGFRGLLSLAAMRALLRILSQTWPSFVWLQKQAVRQWFPWIAAAIATSGLLQRCLDELNDIVFRVGRTKVSLGSFVENSFWVLLAVILSLWAASWIESRVLKPAVADIAIQKISANVLRTILLLVSLLSVLSTLGMDLTTLSVLGGGIGVGLGLGLQKLTTNYVSGFVLLFERSLRIGDSIRLQDKFEGTVTDIRTRYTVVRSVTGEESIVPNERLLMERVENLSLNDTHVLLQTKLNLPLDSDITQVFDLLEKAAVSVPRVLTDPAPYTLLSQFGEYALQVTLCFWIGDPQRPHSQVISHVNVAIHQALQAAGLQIPLPQRVVYKPADLPGYTS
jgi:small-conductance mechanosensitive channel